MASSTKNDSPCFMNMHDGRMFTDYRPRCTTQYELTKQGATSFEQRQELIHNAKLIMDRNASAAASGSECGGCKFAPKDAGTMLPEKRVQQCNSRTCAISPNDPKGLGLGRNYNVSA